MAGFLRRASARHGAGGLSSVAGGCDVSARV